MNQELHDKAWKLLEDKGLTMGERMMVRSSFAETYKNDYPFILSETTRHHSKSETTYYYSTINDIKHLRFKTENEVILANAIYENIKHKYSQSEFIQLLKFTFRILGVESDWV